MAEQQRELAHDWGEKRFAPETPQVNVMVMDTDGHNRIIPATQLASEGLAHIVSSIPTQRKPPLEETIPTLKVTDPEEPRMTDGSYFLG